MESATNTKQESASIILTQSALVLTQIYLSAFVGALSAEKIGRQSNAQQMQRHWLLFS